MQPMALIKQFLGMFAKSPQENESSNASETASREAVVHLYLSNNGSKVWLDQLAYSAEKEGWMPIAEPIRFEFKDGSPDWFEYLTSLIVNDPKEEHIGISVVRMLKEGREHYISDEHPKMAFTLSDGEEALRKIIEELWS